MGSVFERARPQQARLKIGAYGPQGSGKTFTALLVAEGLAKRDGKRVALVDTERGADFYAMKVPQRQVHPEAFEMDVLNTRSLAEVTEAVRGLDPAKYGVVIVDSISHLWDAAIEAYEGKRTKAETIPINAWGTIKKPYKDLIKFLIGSPFHVLILGRQKNLMAKDEESGEWSKVGVGMRAEGETEYEPHICFRMEAVKSKRDSTKSTYLMHVEKDRTGILAGRTVTDPNFETFAPILPLLGAVQAPAEDEEERVAKDAGLIEAERQKVAAKSQRSSEILAELQAKVAGAQTIAALGAIQGEIKKQTRYMVDDHLNALRVLFGERRSVLVTSEAGEV